MIASTASRSPSEPSRPSSPSVMQTSTPPSPTTTITTAASSPTHQHPPAASLDDIFGASPPHPTSLDGNAGQTREPDREPSDLPFLRRQHVTAGYRDGISIAKGEHVQRGFDGGFPVGAELGLRVGIVLGVLEGLATAAAVATAPRGDGGCNGVAKGSKPCGAGGEDIAALFEAAKKELSVQNVFGAVAADVGVEAEEKGHAGQEWVDPCVRLAKAGDDVVAGWERRVRELLAATS
ncbi:hypothetical protein AJ78_02341 [Emergomyces pasteurianus Ep9510]|uniref:Protein YAE1 n=1 Tax=Emergomyces pasteurianus Ep9510 TaxID=1447872 RepID=A0A1J9PN77_9EURO|nr:hypothetical protein AJ78_02341 [Emergomyces pasteurianus Ep9510]